MVVAVLALQGAFLEHEQMLKKLGAEVFEIRQKKDLERPFDAADPSGRREHRYGEADAGRRAL